MFNVPLSSSTDSYLGYMVKSCYWYASPTSLLGMSVPIVFYSGTDPNSSISHMYDMELRMHCKYYPHNCILPNQLFEDLRDMLNYAKTCMFFCEIPTLYSYWTIRLDNYWILLKPVCTR